ncbi:hypothetical protein GJAV_G00090230 [Gymnothorax javanicus]|nr:hypothetical protein GJAV_G00090230 [Gymnothorax javanicus]
MRQRRTVDLRELLALSVEAAVQGGREVKRIRDKNALEKPSGKSKDRPSEKLKIGELNSHRKMYHLIKNTFPFLQVNAEEHATIEGEVGVWNHVIPAELQRIGGGREVPANDVTVWIDSLDAIQEYMENRQKYVTTMVCVAVNGVPVIGVIHKPFAEYTVWALVGSGSSLQPGPSLRVKSLRVVVSHSHVGKAIQFIQTAFGNDTVVNAAGGAGYKILALLDPPDEEQEKADVYLHITYIKKQDICAGNAILKELGGHMTTLKGQAIDYSVKEANHGGVLASVGVDHQALLAKLHIADNQRQRRR